MGEYYQFLDRPHFAYDLYKIPGIKDTSFRGPRFNKSKPYVACIGAAQTFGRFCNRPYPAILAEKLGFQFLNLGVGGAGSLYFDKPPILNLVNKAEFVIVQVLSGRSESNSLFDNRQTGGLMGIRKTDHGLMRFEEFIADLMKRESKERVIEILRETQESFVRNTTRLLQHIHRPKILFWFSNRTPEYHEGFGSVWELLGDFPHLVNQSMLNRLARYTDAYVECVSSSGVPQKLWQADAQIDGAGLEDGWLVNRYYPTPEMHQEAANLLAPVCAHLMPAARRKPQRTGTR